MKATPKSNSDELVLTRRVSPDRSNEASGALRFLDPPIVRPDRIEGIFAYRQKKLREIFA
jgi:hypothetical protein